MVQYVCTCMSLKSGNQLYSLDLTTQHSYLTRMIANKSIFGQGIEPETGIYKGI